MKKTTVYDCSMVEMDKHHHETGNITVIENGKTIPFDVKRVYYLYDIPGGESRGAHAHKELKQLIIAASGSFEVTLDDGNVKRTFTLNRPYQGLLVVPGIWRELNNLLNSSYKCNGIHINNLFKFFVWCEVSKSFTRSII